MVMDFQKKSPSNNPPKKSDREVRLDIPDNLELGQTYSLVVSSNDLSLSARLVKEEIADRSKEEEKKAKTTGDEFQRRIGKMGEALIAEGLQNLSLASTVILILLLQEM